MGTIATGCKDDFKPNRCKSVAKILWRIIITWLAPINKGFFTFYLLFELRNKMIIVNIFVNIKSVKSHFSIRLFQFLQ